MTFSIFFSHREKAHKKEFSRENSKLCHESQNKTPQVNFWKL